MVKAARLPKRHELSGQFFTHKLTREAKQANRSAKATKRLGVLASVGSIVPLRPRPVETRSENSPRGSKYRPRWSTSGSQNTVDLSAISCPFFLRAQHLMRITCVSKNAERCVGASGQVTISRLKHNRDPHRGSSLDRHMSITCSWPMRRKAGMGHRRLFLKCSKFRDDRSSAFRGESPAAGATAR